MISYKPSLWLRPQDPFRLGHSGLPQTAMRANNSVYRGSNTPSNIIRWTWQVRLINVHECTQVRRFVTCYNSIDNSIYLNCESLDVPLLHSKSFIFIKKISKGISSHCGYKCPLKHSLNEMISLGTIDKCIRMVILQNIKKRDCVRF